MHRVLWYTFLFLTFLGTVSCDGEISDLSFDENDKTAPKELFQCSTGQMIQQSKVCDGQNDCHDDLVSDENKTTCPDLPINCTRYTSIKRRCPNTNICITPTDLCDGYNDCGDGADEQSDYCMNFPCDDNHARCPSGRCILKTWLCDGDNDCGDDGWDERNCSILTLTPSPTAACTGGYVYQCDNGQCVNRAFLCDGENDCGDGSDEKNCTKNRICRDDEFHCASNADLGRYECIPKTWICDGEINCRAGEDESVEVCGKPTMPTCEAGTFQCKNGRCIHAAWKCDHDDDCMDGSDEVNCAYETCSPTYFQCASYRCIPKAWVCDRHDDCGDNSDEINCTASTSPPPPTCSPDEFKCMSDSLCIPQRWQCDGSKDCVDGSDESDCLMTSSTTTSEKPGSDLDQQPIRAKKPTINDVTNLDHLPTNTEMKEQALERNRDKANDQKFTSTETPDSPSELDYTNQRTCSPSEFKCPNSRCIPSAWICDGDNDCGDNSDETSCANSDRFGKTDKPICNTTDFQCANSRCIPERAVCDGDDDCGDNSDERYCVEAGGLVGPAVING